MNATKSPVDLLMNIESPSINLAQRRGLSHASERSSDVSALNRKENSFDDVYRQQRREDSEVRQQERSKREVERPDRTDNRPAQAAQNSTTKSSRAENEGTADGKELPRNDASAKEKGETVAAKGASEAETTVSKDVDSVEGKDQQAKVSFDDIDVLAEVKAAVDGVTKEVAEDLDTGIQTKQQESDEAEVEVSLGSQNGDVSDDVTEAEAFTLEAEQNIEVAQQSSQSQATATEEQDKPGDETVIRQDRQSTEKQAVKDTTDADVNTKARTAQVAGVTADVARESRQSRVAESVDVSVKSDSTSNTQTKTSGSGAEQTGQQAGQDRFANLMGTSDFKAMREQLAANTVKVDGTNVAAKAAAVDSAVGADTAADRQPRLNALTQASQALGQAKPGVVTASVQTPMGSPEWGQAMSQRIMWLANRGINAAELHLNPRELGPVDVRINVSGEQAVVQFSSPQAGVREALESSVVRLREMLESNGINLADVDVSDQSQSEQAQANADGRSGSGKGADQGAVEEAVEPVLTQRIESEGLVDFYA